MSDRAATNKTNTSQMLQQRWPSKKATDRLCLCLVLLLLVDDMYIPVVTKNQLCDSTSMGPVASLGCMTLDKSGNARSSSHQMFPRGKGCDTNPHSWRPWEAIPWWPQAAVKRLQEIRVLVPALHESLAMLWRPIRITPSLTHLPPRILQPLYNVSLLCKPPISCSTV